jgi:hypothetical protein
MIHYILVREDLPVGVAAAMISHAAANSAFESSMRDWEDMTTVVLGIPNERFLSDAAVRLGLERGNEVTLFYESDGPYSGQFMSLGVWPDDDAVLKPIMTGYPLYNGPTNK